MKDDMITKLEASCPDCGCTTVRTESRSNQHCNGDWNEEREFRCGRTTLYCPNDHKVRVTEQCDKEKARLRAIRDRVKHRVLDAAKVAAGEFGVDTAWLNRLVMAIGHVNT